MQTNLTLLTYTAPCIINIHWGLTQSMKSNLLKKNPQHCCWNFVIGMTQVAQTCKLRDTGKLCYKWLDVPHVSKPPPKNGATSGDCSYVWQCHRLGAVPTLPWQTIFAITGGICIFVKLYKLSNKSSALKGDKPKLTTFWCYAYHDRGKPTLLKSHKSSVNEGCFPELHVCQTHTPL